MKTASRLPDFKYVGHEKEKLSLHLLFQMMGKIRMCFMPRKNHWWYITLYVNEEGFTTGPMPVKDGFETFSINLKVLDDEIQVRKSTGELKSFALEEGTNLGTFYKRLMEIMDQLSIPVKINSRPYDLDIADKFSEITHLHHYDPDYVRAYWKAFRWTDGVFKEFSGRFYGKTCPVHLYWHSMDLAVTRFSGKKAPPMPEEARISDKDAYSHECISFGFWAGDDNVQEPAFYSYTFPSPEGLDNQPLEPKEANWVMNNGTPMAILTYSDLLEKDNPRKALLEFLESAYQAGASLANWNIKELKVPPLSEL